jgi:hypothetical protein
LNPEAPLPRGPRRRNASYRAPSNNGLSAAIAGAILALGTAGLLHAEPQNASPVAPTSPSSSARFREPDCHSPTSRDDANYCAQRDAVDAARDQAIWAKWQSIVGALGVGLVIVTLYYSRKSTDSAIRATEIAEKALRNADRPYLLPDGVSFGDVRLLNAEGHNLFKWRITNFGKGPAFTRRYIIHVAVVEDVPPTPEYPYFWDLGATIAPGAQIQSDDSRPAFLALSEQDRADILRHAKKLLIVGRVDYAGISGADHSTRFAYVFRPYNDPASDTFIPVANQAYWENT